MSWQLYPGQYTFHILDNKGKHAKQKSATRIKVAKLQERYIQKQHNAHVITEQMMTKLALERYIQILKGFMTYTN